VLPLDGQIIEMTTYGETVLGVRVVRTKGPVITLSMALDRVPPDNSPVELRWPGGPRGRVARKGDVIAVDGNRVQVRFTTGPVVLQSRLYVRGGGGEPVVMSRPELDTPAAGVVHDISEHAVRAHFAEVESAVEVDDEVTLTVDIDGLPITLPATVLKVISAKQKAPDADGPLSVEMVAVFTEDNEAEAKIIRRYIMRHQLIERQRGPERR
jgi:hypothetical protein